MEFNSGFKGLMVCYPQVFSDQIVLCNSCFDMGAKYRAQLILLDFISLIILGDK